MIEFPILIEELELANGYLLQKRMSGCGTRAAVTIQTADIVVLFKSLDSPHTELASCKEEVTTAIGAHDVRTAAFDTVDVVNWDRDGIVADTTENSQLLASARAAIKISKNNETVANAQAVIDSSREILTRHRKVINYAETQLIRYEKSVVTSRLKISQFGHDGERSPEEGNHAAEVELRSIAEKRAAILEERSVIREAELAIGQTLGALPKA